MDKLEKFIRDNREAFDQETPDLRIWSAIDQQINQKEARVFHLHRLLRVAAAVVTLLLAGGFAGAYLMQSNEILPPAGIAQSKLPAEFREVEGFYQDQYQEKVHQLAGYQVDPTFEEDLQTFESVISELKAELANAPAGNEERIIGAIIQNYQTKIEILQRILERVENTNPQNSKSKRNETSI